MDVGKENQPHMWSELSQRWHEDEVRREAERLRDTMTQARIRILFLVIAKSLHLTHFSEEEVTAAVTAVTVASLFAFEEAATQELAVACSYLPPAVAQCLTQTLETVRRLWSRVERDVDSADWEEWIDSL